MIATFIELLIIVGIVVYQFRILGQNTQKIKRLANVYPKPDQLSVGLYYLDSRGEEELNEGESEDDSSQYYEDIASALDAGEPFIYPANHLQVHQVKEIKGDYRVIEVTEYNNDNDAYFEREYPTTLSGLINLLENETIVFINDVHFVGSEADTGAENYDRPVVDLIEAEKPSAEFEEIMRDTNEYLENNKGAAADFNILKDISERYSEALDNEVQAGIATPLYIGLLGTFLGVGFGLGTLLSSGTSGPVDLTSTSSSFISDDGIYSFLLGVVIAMIGSFCGLLLTLYGNYLLKEGRSKRDKLKNSYYTFLQKRLLPKLNSDMAASLGSLKSVLDSFNQDFLEKVANFQPIISSLTENIRIQKDFIVKLDEIGFTRMANASIKVFDKVKESEELFEKFLGYQASLNRTLATGADMTEKIKSVLSKMTKLEEGFALVPGYLEKHDESIMRQVQFFNQHQKALDDISSKVEQNLDEDAAHLKKLMDKRLSILENDAQNAFERWQEHFNKINEENVYQKIVEYMQPFSKLNEQQEALNIQQSVLAKSLEVSNDRLLRKLEKDTDLQQRLVDNLAVTNRLLAEATKRNRIQIMMDKVFGVPVNGSNRGKG